MDPSFRWGDGGAMITSSIPDYRDAVPEGGRLLGLDVGTKTIGLALCDSGWTIATPAELLRRGKFSADLERVRTLATAQQVRGLVVGLPLNLDGSDSPRTQSVRAFARNLAPIGLPLLLWDERWSTQAVTRTLLEADASRARRAELVDKMAAAYILQGAIDALTMG
jgi:putative Holliday junction resolvase